MIFYSSDEIRKLDALYNVIMGQRSHGKTYDMIKHIVQEYWDARKRGEIVQAAYIRRYRENLTTSKMANVGKALLHNGYGENEIRKITDGQYDNIYYYMRQWFLCKYDEKGERIKDREPFMYAFDLNTSMDNRGGDYPFIKTIWYEEFMEINASGYIPNEFVIFTNLISTIARHKKDVKIWLTGNTLDIHSPYFADLGISKVKKQKPGTIECYKMGKTDKKIAVEITCTNSDYQTSEFNNDYLFAFDKPEMEMITDGGWSVSAYPLFSGEIKYKDICGQFYIDFDDEFIECDIVSNGKDCFIYAHQDIDPLNQVDLERDLICSGCYNPRYNYVYGFKFSSMVECGSIILNLIRSGKVFFDNNQTGDTFNSFVLQTGS